MNKLITALEGIIKAQQLYWEKNNKADFPELPEDEEWSKAITEAEAVLVDAKQHYDAHVTQVGRIYEALKDKIALSQPGTMDYNEQVGEIWSLLQDLRNLACALYNPALEQAIKEANIPLS